MDIIWDTTPNNCLPMVWIRCLVIVFCISNTSCEQKYFIAEVIDVVDWHLYNACLFYPYYLCNEVNCILWCTSRYICKEIKIITHQHESRLSKLKSESFCRVIIFSPCLHRYFILYTQNYLQNVNGLGWLVGCRQLYRGPRIMNFNVFIFVIFSYFYQNEVNQHWSVSACVSFV